MYFEAGSGHTHEAARHSLPQDSESDRAFYIVQEVVSGRSIAQMLQSGMRCTEEEVRPLPS